MSTSSVSCAIEVLLFLLPASESPEEAGWHAWCLYRHDGVWCVRYGTWAGEDQLAGRLVKCSRPGKLFGPADADRIKSERLARGYQLAGLFWLDPDTGALSWSRDYWTDPATGKVVRLHQVPTPSAFPDTPREDESTHAPQMQGRRWPRVIRLPQ